MPSTPHPILPDAIYTVEQAAQVVPLSPYTLRKYLRAGVIRGKGKPWRVLGRELLKLA